jgi:quinol monooxygenase YgiN
MFARIVEFEAKRGRREDVNARITNDIVPVLQQQLGFVDFIALSDKAAPDRVVCISLWESREHAEKHHQQHYETIVDMLRPVLQRGPSLETFSVTASTAYRIAVARAA